MTASAVCRRVAVLLCLVVGSSAWAQTPMPPRRLYLGTFTVVRYNPIGLDQHVSMNYQQRIGDSDALLFRTRHWRTHLTGTVNPANWSLAAGAVIEPIAVFQLRAAAELRGHFGTFNEFLPFTTTTGDFSDEGRAAAGERGENYSTTRINFRVEPVLRAAFGPIAIENTFGFHYGIANVRDASQIAFYEPSWDVLAPTDGVVLKNNLNLVYLAGPLTAGATWEWITPMGLGSENVVHRAGPLLAYQFFDRPNAWFNKPTLLALALFNLKHPRRGALLPTFIVGFATQTDLLGGGA